MKPTRLFLPQGELDRWVSEARATVQGEVLTISSGLEFDLRPAVRFLADVAESGDPHGLLGRVKEKDQLSELGAEHYMGSVVLGDSAYEVEEGFVGYVRALGRGSAEAAQPALESDEALLTKFLLEKL